MKRKENENGEVGKRKRKREGRNKLIGEGGKGVG